MELGQFKKYLPILFWVGVIFFSLSYYYPDIEKYIFYSPEDIGARKLPYQWWIIVHFTTAACTLFLGPIQFISYIRKRYIRIHRAAGKVYIIGSLISASTVFVLLATSYSLDGALPTLALLAVIWIATTWIAYISIRRGQVAMHQAFMIRSYVCGLAFIFIRLLPEINALTGLFDFIEDDTMRSTVYEWVCWVYPLAFTEYFLSWRPMLLKTLAKN